MTDEDLLRGRLRSAASEMPVGSGSLTGVQARAAQLQRRRSAVRGGVGAFALVAVALVGVVSLRDGGIDEYSTTMIDSDDSAGAAEAESMPATTAAVPASAADEDMADDKMAVERLPSAVFAVAVTAVSPPPGADAADVRYFLSEGRARARVSDAWFVHDGTQWRAAEPPDVSMPEAEQGRRGGPKPSVLHETKLLGVVTSVEVSGGVAWLKHGERVWEICPIPHVDQAHSMIGWMGEHVAIVVGIPEQSLYLLERID